MPRWWLAASYWLTGPRPCLLHPRPRPPARRSVTGLTSLRTLLLAMNCMSAAQERFVLPGPYLQGLALLGLSDCFDEDSGVRSGPALCVVVS